MPETSFRWWWILGMGAKVMALCRFWGARFYLLVEHLREGKQNVDVGCGDCYLFSSVLFRIVNGCG